MIDTNKYSDIALKGKNVADADAVLDTVRNI